MTRRVFRARLEHPARGARAERILDVPAAAARHLLAERSPAAQRESAAVVVRLPIPALGAATIFPTWLRPPGTNDPAIPDRIRRSCAAALPIPTPPRKSRIPEAALRRETARRLRGTAFPARGAASGTGIA